MPGTRGFPGSDPSAARGSRTRRRRDDGTRPLTEECSQRPSGSRLGGGGGGVEGGANNILVLLSLTSDPLGGDIWKASCGGRTVEVFLSLRWASGRETLSTFVLFSFSGLFFFFFNLVPANALTFDLRSLQTLSTFLLDFFSPPFLFPANPASDVWLVMID